MPPSFRVSGVLALAVWLVAGAAEADPDIARGRAVALGSLGGQAPATACATCHGVDGAGDPSGAFPRLDGQAVWYLYKQLKDYADGRREHAVMSAIARQLSDADRENVAAYYAAQQPAATPVPEADAETLQHGGAISATGIEARGVPACENCHGADGAGMPPSFPYLAGQYAPYVELQLRRFRDGARINDPVQVMRDLAHDMSDDEIAAVAAYLEAARGDEERQGDAQTGARP